MNVKSEKVIETEPITTMEALEGLEKKYEKANLLLKKASPDKSQEFILFRGENGGECEEEKHTDLASSLQRWCRGKYGESWRNQVKTAEREMVEGFIKIVRDNELMSDNELAEQYSWMKGAYLEHGEDDTVWYLSVLQHFGGKTRFVDFTADFWTAFFFASESKRTSNEDSDMILYALRCKNEDGNDAGGNKLPKDCSGQPWKVTNNDRTVTANINKFLGHVIGYGVFNNPKKQKTWEQEECKWNPPQQAFGWDRPTFLNARIKKQKGFLVYPVDVTKTLDEILDSSPTKYLEKYTIDKKLRPEIRAKLGHKGINSWAVYLDLDRAIKSMQSLVG